MRTLFRKSLYAATAAAVVVACGGGDKNEVARSPSTDTTQTTAATPSQQPMGAQDQQMQQPQGYTFDQSQQGGVGQDGMGGSTQGGMGQGGTAGGTSPLDTNPYGGSSGATSADQGTSGAASGTSKAKVERALNDSEIFAVASAANDGHIQLAEIAKKSARSMQVKSFAQSVLTDHKNAENKLKQITSKAKITATDNEVSNQLKSDTQSMVSELKGLKGADFDRSYIDDEVKAHRNDLDIVDNRLLPNVSSSELKTHISDVRAKLSDHLSKAEDIQAKLGQQPVGAAAAQSRGEAAKAKTPATTEKKPDIKKEDNTKKEEKKDTTPKKSPDSSEQGGSRY